MRVGVNYPWPWRAYGTYFGGGQGGDADDAWLARWPASVGANLPRFRAAGVEVVRIFLLCNGHGWGRVDGARFTPPDRVPPAMLAQLRELLTHAAQHDVKLIPSFVDFHLAGATYDPPWGGGSGRASALCDVDARDRLLDLLSALVEASRPFGSSIHAWEIMNEPSWATRWFAPPTRPPRRPAWLPHAPPVTRRSMRAFLAKAAARIERGGFASTVGHRFASDLAAFPTGTLPQLHYYAEVYPSADGRDLPAARRPDGRVAFLGEIAAGSHGKPWPSLRGRDVGDPSERVFARLEHARARGYELALLWPDLSFDDVDPVRSGAMTWQAFTASPVDPLTFSDGALRGLARSLGS